MKLNLNGLYCFLLSAVFGCILKRPLKDSVSGGRAAKVTAESKRFRFADLWGSNILNCLVFWYSKWAVLKEVVRFLFFFFLSVVWTLLLKHDALKLFFFF